jgi:hypothetical protein
VSYCSFSGWSTIHGCTMSSICNPAVRSGRGLLALVVAACSLISMGLPVALVQIIRQFGGTACTSLGTLGSGASILWLMGLIMNSLSTTQGEQRIMDLRFGSFQAFADAVQWGIMAVQKLSRYICSGAWSLIYLSRKKSLLFVMIRWGVLVVF